MDPTLFNQIYKRALEAVKRPEVPVNASAETIVADHIAETLTPVIENLSNREPLWKSRVVRGLLIAAVGVVGGFFGLNVSDGDVDQFIQIGSGLIELGGLAYALYGRVTTKPAPRI